MADTRRQASPLRFASALALLTLLAGLATASYGVHAWYAARADRYAQLDNLARLAAKSATYFFNRFDAGLSTLGQDILNHGGLANAASAHAMLARYQAATPGVAAVNIFDTQGNWLLTSNRPPGTDLPSIQQLPHWKEDLQASVDSVGLSIGRPFPGAIVRQRIIAMKFAVRDERGDVRFVLSAAIALSDQQQIWNNVDVPADGLLGIVREDGYIQSRFPPTPNDDEVYGRRWGGPVFRAAYEGKRSPHGRVESRSPVDGQTRLTSYQKLEGYPLATFVAAPRASIWHAWLKLVQVPFALFAVLALGSLWIYRHLSKQYESWGDALNARQERLELLHLISSSMTSRMPFYQLVDRLLQQLTAKRTDWRAAFCTIAPEGHLSIMRARGLAGSTRLSGARVEPNAAAELVKALSAGQPIAIADTLNDNRLDVLAAHLSASRMRACLAAPLMTGNTLLGTLCVASQSPHAWSEQELKMMAELAAQLSLALTESRTAEDRRRALAELQESRERFRSLAEMSSDWFWEQDDQYRFTYLSPGVQQRLIDNGQGFIGKRRWEIASIEGVTPEQWQAHRRQLEAREPFTDFIYRFQARGQVRYASINGKPVFDLNGRFVGYRGTGKDITAQKESEARIRYLARNDELTGLTNRTSFQEQLDHAVRQSQRHGRKLGVLFIDLDRFKNINDTLGHNAGDALLQEVGRRLIGCLRESDTLARWGGDEFVAMLEEVTGPNDVALVARRILDELCLPYRVDGQEFVVTASVGISAFPGDGEDAQTLLKAADIAMYRAKEAGKNNFQYYSPQMNIHTFERLALESNLRRALDRGEFLLHYQPKVDLRTGALCGAEALIRWQHPDMGLVSPMQFIPLAEETGLIVPIGSWVLRTACAQAKAWHSSGLQPVRIAVNISSRQFSQAGLLDEIVSVLQDTGLDPDMLELEITESMLMHDPEQTVAMLNELKAIGIHLAIDDFGTGYSSLAYLKRFPVSTLKIDRSFVKDIPADADDVAITLAIVSLAHNLRIRVTAEGVETEAQRTFLRRHGCDEVQGYLSGRPVAKEDFAKLLVAEQRAVG